MENGNGLVYIREFIAIADFLYNSDKAVKGRDYIGVPRDVINILLGKNAYDTADGKLQVWKRLRWIDTDPEHYTKKVSYNGKRIRVVKIQLVVFQTLKSMFSNV